MESVTKNKKQTSGRWTKAQHDKFMNALQKYGRDWAKVQKKIKTRSLLQIRSHAQKVFLNMSENDIIAFIGNDKELENSPCQIKENHIRKTVSTRKNFQQNKEKLQSETDEVSPNKNGEPSLLVEKLDDNQHQKNTFASKNNICSSFLEHSYRNEAQIQTFQFLNEDKTGNIIRQNILVQEINQYQNLVLSNLGFSYQLWNNQPFYQPVLFPF